MSKTASQWFDARARLTEIEAESPPAFDDLSKIDRGAVLLAIHEGECVQYFNVKKGKWLHWMDYDNGISGWESYRIAPARIRGTVDVDADGNPDFDTWFAE